MPAITPFLPLLKELPVPGDFMELGVNEGDSFVKILEVAGDRACHAVDSFHGLAEPGPDDPAVDYPAGKFDQGGADKLIARLKDKDGCWFVWEGFVPAILARIKTGPIAVAFVDLDHCEPTRAALDWLWPRLAVGGLLICDDHYPASPRTGANLATEEFLQGHVADMEFVMEGNSRTTVWRKIR